MAIRVAPTPALVQALEHKPTTGKQFSLTDVAALLRITEWFGLGGIFKDHLVQPSAVGSDIFHQIRGLQKSS